MVLPGRASWAGAAVVLGFNLVALVLADPNPQPESLFRNRMALPVDRLTRSRSNLVSLGVPKDYAVCTSLDGGKGFLQAESQKTAVGLSRTPYTGQMRE